MNKTIQDVAKEMLDNLTTKQRGEKTIYVTKKTIDWQVNIIHDAHLDRLPDDSIYSFIHEALDAIYESEEGQEEDAIYEIEADVYTHGLTSWLNESNSNVYYLTEALEEYGSKDGFQALGMAQQLMKHEVARKVLSGIEEYIDGRDI